VTAAEGAPRDAGEGQRLHPLTVLLELGRALGQSAWALVLVLVVSALGGRRGDPLPLVFLVAGSGTLVALARYLSLRYWVAGGRLVIRSGLVSQQLRTIPLDKIQNVELRQNALHQLGGVVDLRIETAAGPQAEAHLAVLSLDAADRLRAQLLAGREAEPGVAVATQVSEVVWQAGLRELLLIGATSNRAGAIVGAFAGLLLFIGREVPRYLDSLQAGLVAVLGAASPQLVAGVVAAALLVAGWLLSIGLSVVGIYGFTLTREPDGRLRRSYGLVSRFETVIAPARIQLLRLESSWLRRRLGFWEVAAHTAGSALEGEGAASALLCPLLPRVELAGFCRRLTPGFELDAVAWRPVSRATLRRGFVRYLVVPLALLGLAAPALGWWAWLGAAPAAAGALWLARRRFAVLAYARHAGHLLARTGLGRRRITIVPEGKAQWIGLTQSPPQRRYASATARVATASGSAVIPDLPLDEALALQSQLAGAASAAGAWLPDAV